MLNIIKRSTRRLNFFNQVVVGVLSLVLVLVIFSSILTYFELKNIATRVARQSLLTDASSLQSDLATRLISLASSNKVLAENALIGNALVDDVGRDIYLGDFLEGYRSAEGFTLKVALSNFAGKPISENHMEIPLLAEEQWLREIVKTGHATSMLIKDQDKPVLLIAEPVLFRNTGLPEGALVYQVRLSEWLNFSRVRQVYAEGISTGKLSLRYIDNRSELLESVSSQSTEEELSELNSLFFLELGQSLTPLNISLELTAKQSLVDDPARDLFIRVVLVSIIFLVVAAGLSILVANKLSKKLVRLKEAVTGIDDYRKGDLLLVSEGVDEVDDLSEAFDLVLKKLQEAYLQVEVQAKKKIEESEGRFRAIITNSADAIITIDESGLIETFNPAAERIFGYKAEDVIGKNTSILIPRENRDEHDDYVKQSTLERARVLKLPRELYGRRQNGDRFPVEVNVAPIYYKNRKSFVGIIRDVSERRAYEDGLRLAKLEAEQASRAKSEFLSSMSHELRTPLNAILGFSQVMQINTNLNKEDYKNVTEIFNAGQHLLELVNDVLDLAKIEAGKTTVQMEELRVSQLLDECVLMVKSEAKKAGITIKKDYTSSDLGVLADKIRLKQVLLNLLSNAIKYNRPGGSLTLGCVARVPGRVRIAVSDTGYGLTADEQEQVFQPFNRLGREGGKIEGTGIGLSITRRLVEMMGGEISVTSEKDRGSTFSVDLAMVEYQQLLQSIEQENGEGMNQHGDSGKRVSILYIEDNPANLRLMECLLEKFNRFDFICAEEPVAGLELAREKKPDVILLDIQLPSMDGYEVLEKLKEDSETSSIPVIAVTADAMNTSMEGAKEAGFFDYLTKPINAEKLINSIDVALVS